jgi:hypothetical protein
VARLRAWRNEAINSIDGWLEAFEADSAPDLPEIPVIDSSVLDASPFLAADAIALEKEHAETESRNAAAATAERLRTLVMQHEGELVALEDSVRTELEGAGFDEGSELLSRLELLRSRLGRLTTEAADLAVMRRTIDEAIP